MAFGNGFFLLCPLFHFPRSFPPLYWYVNFLNIFTNSRNARLLAPDTTGANALHTLFTHARGARCICGVSKGHPTIYISFNNSVAFWYLLLHQTVIVESRGSDFGNWNGFLYTTKKMQSIQSSNSWYFLRILYQYIVLKKDVFLLFSSLFLYLKWDFSFHCFSILFFFSKWNTLFFNFQNIYIEFKNISEQYILIELLFIGSLELLTSCLSGSGLILRFVLHTIAACVCDQTQYCHKYSLSLGICVRAKRARWCATDIEHTSIAKCCMWFMLIFGIVKAQTSWCMYICAFDMLDRIEGWGRRACRCRHISVWNVCVQLFNCVIVN